MPRRSETPTPYRVHCHDPHCEGFNGAFLTRKEYMIQMENADSRWKCPICNCSASWDNDSYEDHIRAELAKDITEPITSLSVEDQKLLTEEILKQCWHSELCEMIDCEDGFVCPCCEEPAALVDGDTEVVDRPDFESWAIIARLVFVIKECTKNGDRVRAEIQKAIFSDKPQLNICLAILNHLKEKGGHL